MDMKSFFGCKQSAYVLSSALALLALLALPAEAGAQWQTSGNNISNTNTGNVGVGTNTPGTKLTVVTSIAAEATASANSGLGLMGNDANNGYLQLYDASRTLQVYFASRSGVNSYINNGNFGIGTASPERKLHIKDANPVEFENSTSGKKWHIFTGDNGGNDLDFAETGVAGGILHLKAGGNVGIGTTSPGGKFEVAGGSIFLGDMGNAGWGNMIVRGRVFSASNNIHLSPPGGSTVYINSDYREAGGATGLVNLSVSGTITGGNIQATYQDVAEWVPSSQKLQAGTVVVLDTDRANHVLASTKSYDTRVAGVVSASPGVILGEGGDGKLKVATTGRVKVKVDATRAPIHVGDLLVTSDVEGVAMKSVPVDLGGVQIHRPGTIIGKALEPLEKGTGEILVLLSLQ